MAKLFLFGIGGTGSRVLRAFTMLMAAGVKVANCDSVVPIIIDPDSQNGDMNRTVELMKTYKRLHNHLGNRTEGFFHQDISTLASVAGQNSGIPDSFVYNFSGRNKSFKEFIDYGQLSVDNRALVELLFTEENLSNSLDVGFRGSPNVGSVVLNDIMSSDLIRYFATNFQRGDRVFFISSIFGGTGAAGFPLLLKNFRDPDSGLPNATFLNNAAMGAITVLPYFSLEQPDADANHPDKQDFIDSNTFITKTKAALSYYQHNLESLNALYYIGDTPEKPLENNPGRAAQQNEAHLIELLSALSILDFMDYSDEHLQHQTLFHEYGLKEDIKNVHFSHLGAESKEKIAQQLIQFHYFDQYFINQTPSDTQAPYFVAGNLGNALKNEPVFKDLRDFLRNDKYGYHKWLKELRSNKRAFEAINPDEKDFNRMIADKEIATGFFDKGLTAKAFLGELIVNHKNVTDPDPFRKFITIFENASRKMMEEKLKYH